MTVDSDNDSLTTNQGNKWVRRLLPLAVLLLAGGGTVLLVKSRKPPARKKRPRSAQLVEVMHARAERRQVEVVSNGVVQPRREVSLVPEVSGRVRAMHPDLVVGGMVRRGAVLVAIEPADYKSAVEKARSLVAQARRGLVVAQSNARVARSEWDRLGKQAGTAPSPLTLHEPQLKEAEALLAAAKADLEMAQLNLKRTVIRAPFNLRVRSEQVEVGQYVRVGQEIARVYGTDVAEAVVPLPVSELRWLKIPTHDGEQGSPVTVRLKTGESTHERQGRLVRAVGEVDVTGRMSKVVVGIDDPFNLKPGNTGGPGYRPAFEIGAFVEVALEGRMLDRVIPIPAEALRRGSKVWVAGPQEKLQVRPVTTARVTETEALVLSGLEPGDRVVLSNVGSAVEGMQLRVRERSGETGERDERAERAEGKKEARVQ